MKIMTDIVWSIEKRKISDLKDYSKNPRVLTKIQEDHLRGSLTKFGLIDKPIVNLDNTIIGGHQRRRTLKKMGFKEIDVNLPSRLLSEKEIEELNILLNRVHGEFDFDILSNEFDISDLVNWGFSLEEFQVKLNKEEDEPKEDTHKCDKCGQKIKNKK